MSHDPHHALPGYTPAQMLVDGCGECTACAGFASCGIGALDSQRFEQAWKRAAAWQRDEVHDISRNELRMLAALWDIQVQLERRGIPIGEVPRGV